MLRKLEVQSWQFDVGLSLWCSSDVAVLEESHTVLEIKLMSPRT